MSDHEHEDAPVDERVKHFGAEAVRQHDLDEARRRDRAAHSAALRGMAPAVPEVVDPEPQVEAQTRAVSTVHPRTGEVVNLRDASLEQLAEAAGDAIDLESRLKEFQGDLSEELLARLDKSGVWTQRVKSPDNRYEWEITSASPDAGSVGYDAVQLDIALRTLMAKEVINDQAASAALKRQITVTLAVPFSMGLEDTETAIAEGRILLAHVPAHLTDDAGRPPVKLKELAGPVDVVGVEVTSTSSSRSPAKAGINRLLKIPAAVADIAGAEIPIRPPARKAKVKMLTKDRSGA